MWGRSFFSIGVVFIVGQLVGEGSRWARRGDVVLGASGVWIGHGSGQVGGDVPSTCYDGGMFLWLRHSELLGISRESASIAPQVCLLQPCKLYTQPSAESRLVTEEGEGEKREEEMGRTGFKLRES